MYKTFYTYQNKEVYYFRTIILRLNKNRIKIIYLINPTAGLANTMRGISSTIYLSYFSNTSFFIKGWNSILYYFNFPKQLISINNTKSIIKFNRFNINIIERLESKLQSVLITDIHGFMNVLLKKYIKSKELILLKNVYSIKRVNTAILNSIVYKEIFIPSKVITEYIDVFNMKKKKKKVLGIHIRSGKFMNNFTENYFSSNVNLYLYYEKSNQLIGKYNLSYVFAISDNENLLQGLKKYYYNKLINISFKGNIIHSRFSLYHPIINNNAIRIVSEFILLSSCDVILGTKYSSFSSESCKRLLNKCFNI